MNSDKAFLRHILEETRFLVKHFRRLELQDILENEVLQRACLRSLEVIGEAAKRVSNQLKEKYSAVEWRKIAGLRDKLIHRYFGVDWDIIWDIICNKIPKLKTDVERIIEKEYGESAST